MTRPYATVGSKMIGTEAGIQQGSRPSYSTSIARMADCALKSLDPDADQSRRSDLLRALARYDGDTEGAFHGTTYNGVPNGLAIVQPHAKTFVAAKTFVNVARRQAFGERNPFYGCPVPLCLATPGVPNYSFPYPRQAVISAKYL